MPRGCRGFLLVLCVIRIVADGPTGRGAKVFDAETGEDLTVRLQVVAINIRVATNEIITAQLECNIEGLDLRALGRIVEVPSEDEARN